MVFLANFLIKFGQKANILTIVGQTLHAIQRIKDQTLKILAVFIDNLSRNGQAEFTKNFSGKIGFCSNDWCLIKKNWRLILFQVLNQIIQDLIFWN